MSQVVEQHLPCPACGSRDNLTRYDDHDHCFGCGHHPFHSDVRHPPETAKMKETVAEESSRYIRQRERAIDRPLTPLPNKAVALKARGLNAETVKRYKITVNTDPDNPIEAVFPRFNDSGEHVSNQVRFSDKQFRVEGIVDGAHLFGQDAFPEGGKVLTICEGYYDAPSAFQMQGSRYPHVAVMSASTAQKEIVQNFEYVDSFETVVLNFDNDKPGQDAAKEIANLFAPGKVKLMVLQKAKDANEYLMNGWGKEYVDEFWRSPSYMPDGLKLGSDLWDDIENHKIPHSVPYPWSGLNDKTYGIRLSEFVLLTADTGVGKTSFVKEIEYSLLMNPELKEKKYGVGFLHLEEPKYDTAIGLMSIHAGKPFHLPDTERTIDDLRDAYDAVVNSNRVVIWDHFGSNDVDVVLAKIRHMAALGCRYIVVDHLSIIVSDQSGDERKQLDEISTKLKTLTMNLGIACICVIHINRQGLVRGSAGPEQVSNIVIRLERDKKDASEWRRNVMKVSVEKNRFCGRTGPACYLHWEEQENRLKQLSRELSEVYEQGGSSTAGHEFDLYVKG